MTVSATILDGPLPAATAAPAPSGAGATLAFEGIVRPLEDDRRLTALDYEAYLPMAEDLLRDLAAAIADKHGLLAVHVQHSRGRVAVEGCSFRLLIHARHRKEALAAMDEYIDRMKKDIPIWKRAVWAGDPLGARPG